MHLMVSIMCLAKDSDKAGSISKLLTWFLQLLSIKPGTGHFRYNPKSPPRIIEMPLPERFSCKSIKVLKRSKSLIRLISSEDLSRLE